jgi:crotonobetainyl-CoA:carnitine CoA-transferase CaiB-like acyl-CoA transferase
MTSQNIQTDEMSMFALRDTVSWIFARQAGPMTAQLLADMGAEVIQWRLEKLDGLGWALVIGTDVAGDEGKWPDMQTFHALNEQLSITLVTAPRGHLYMKLVSLNDIVIDNSSPGVMEAGT